MPADQNPPAKQFPRNERVPVARAVATTIEHATAAQVKALAEPFKGTSVGQRFFGPGWIGEDGVACIVFIAQGPS